MRTCGYVSVRIYLDFPLSTWEFHISPETLGFENTDRIPYGIGMKQTQYTDMNTQVTSTPAALGNRRRKKILAETLNDVANHWPCRIEGLSTSGEIYKYPLSDVSTRIVVYSHAVLGGDPGRLCRYVVCLNHMLLTHCHRDCCTDTYTSCVDALTQSDPE